MKRILAQTVLLGLYLPTIFGCMQADPSGMIDAAIHSREIADREQKVEKLNARIKGLQADNEGLNERRRELSLVLRGDLKNAGILWEGKEPAYKGALGSIWAVRREADTFTGSPLWIGNPAQWGEIKAVGRAMRIENDSVIVEAPLAVESSAGVQESLAGRAIFPSSGAIRIERDVRSSVGY